MSPPEKIRLRSEAAKLLGVSANATRQEVRRAWRAMVFNAHPDQGEGRACDMEELKLAYRTLVALSDDEARAPKEVDLSRPNLQKATNEIPEEEREKCQKLLEEEGVEGIAPGSLRRQGRNMSYLVQSPLKKGTNHIAVMTGDLTDRRNKKPICIKIDEGIESQDTYELPEDLRDELFPGARRVRFHFDAA